MYALNTKTKSNNQHTGLETCNIDSPVYLPPSRVTAVHPSSQTLILLAPSTKMGSIVNTIPGVIITLLRL